MKYTCIVNMNLPIDKVVALWNNEDFFKEWQDGFEKIDLLSGDANTIGAKSKIIFDGKRRIELIETIISNDLPHKKIALYEHIHMTNTQTSSFKAIEKNETQYTSEVEYTQFNGFLIKMMAKLFPSKFKAQSQKWMNKFKDFAESKYVT